MTEFECFGDGVCADSKDSDTRCRLAVPLCSGTPQFCPWSGLEVTWLKAEMRKTELDCVIKPEPKSIAVALVNGELERAKAKHPKFPAGVAGIALIAEELGELAQAVNDHESEKRIMTEAAHVAVTAIRFIEELAK